MSAEESLHDVMIRERQLEAHILRSTEYLKCADRELMRQISMLYLAIALLTQAGSGNIGQDALERRCHLMAQRMSLLYGLNSPEFFDKSLFRNFIDLLRRRGVIMISPDGALVFGEPLLGVAADAQFVLSEQIRHSILQVTLG